MSLVGIDDQAAATLGTTRADLGDIGDEAVVVRDLFTALDVAKCDPPRAQGLGLVVPLRLHFGVRITRVIEPARLIDEVPEDVLAESGIFARQDQRVRVIEVVVLFVEHAVAEADGLALQELARGAPTVAVDLGRDDLDTVEQWHGGASLHVHAQRSMGFTPPRDEPECRDHEPAPTALRDRAPTARGARVLLSDRKAGKA